MNPDQLDRLKSLATLTTGYLYDLGATGNRSDVMELTGRSITWSYDDINRLTGESISGAPSKANANITYALDPVGNRSSETSTAGGPHLPSH